MPGRGAVPVDELTQKEKTAWHENLRKRLGTEMGAFYAQQRIAEAAAK